MFYKKYHLNSLIQKMNEDVNDLEIKFINKNNIIIKISVDKINKKIKRIFKDFDADLHFCDYIYNSNNDDNNDWQKFLEINKSTLSVPNHDVSLISIDEYSSKKSLATMKKLNTFIKTSVERINEVVEDNFLEEDFNKIKECYEYVYNIKNSLNNIIETSNVNIKFGRSKLGEFSTEHMSITKKFENFHIFNEIGFQIDFKFNKMFFTKLLKYCGLENYVENLWQKYIEFDDYRNHIIRFLILDNRPGSGELYYKLHNNFALQYTKIIPNIFLNFRQFMYLMSEFDRYELQKK